MAVMFLHWWICFFDKNKNGLRITCWQKNFGGRPYTRTHGGGFRHLRLPAPYKLTSAIFTQLFKLKCALKLFYSYFSLKVLVFWSGCPELWPYYRLLCRITNFLPNNAIFYCPLIHAECPQFCKKLSAFARNASTRPQKLRSARFMLAPKKNRDARIMLFEASLDGGGQRGSNIQSLPRFLMVTWDRCANLSQTWC